MFQVSPEAYPSVDNLNVGSVHTRKCKITLESFARDKRSRLLDPFLNYSRTKFNKIGPRATLTVSLGKENSKTPVLSSGKFFITNTLAYQPC